MVAAAVTAFGMHYGLAWDWGSAVVFGVLISATDPVSVIATFKESKAHGRLRMLIESESLLNDGTAAVAFVAVLGVLAGGHETVYSIGGALIVTIIGGILIGGIIAYLFMLLAGRTPDYLVEITFTTLVAYGSFFVAEHFRCSGVLAALTAGLVVGNFRSSGSISAAGRHALGPFWEYVAFVANSLIFLLDWGARGPATFQRPVGTGIARNWIGNAWARGCRLSALRCICPYSIQGGHAPSARTFLGWTAGGLGACAVLVVARGSASARRHRRDYVCRRSLLSVRTRIDDYPADAPSLGQIK